MKIASIKINLLLGVFFLGMLATNAQRIEIDRLEREFRGNFSSRKAYELSQKMIQLDSTYYTGHFFESHSHEHSIRYTYLSRRTTVQLS